MALRTQPGDDVEHPARIGGAQRRAVVENGHRPFFLAAGFRVDRPDGGFSASSISITGMPSRTGYR